MENGITNFEEYDPTKNKKSGKTNKASKMAEPITAPSYQS
jgi:hypothetical protein